MITVKELLYFSEFKEFNLIAGEKGLNNVVLGTGILDHEADSMQRFTNSFEKGEFIVSSLLFGKNDPAYVEQCLIQLIDQQVSAIAVKNVYFDDLSDSFKDYANRNSVPIFIFKDVFIDDIIFAIKNALARMNMSTFYEKIVECIIKQDGNKPIVSDMAKEINSLFFNNIICAYCNKRDSASDEIISNVLKKLEYRELESDEFGERIAYSLFKYRKGILLIYTTNNSIVSCDKLTKFLDFIGITDKHFIIGVSDSHSSLDDLGLCVRKSIYSFISCRLENKTLMQFNETGIDQVILPLRNNYWMECYYNQLSNVIINYDQNHDANLMETAINYIKSKYDITLTAKLTFQHSNTIRYKLNKLRKLLSLQDSDSFNEQLFIIVRLYLARNIFSDI